MERTQIDPRWPNALRWFLAQDLTSLTPWHFIQTPDEMAFAAKAFAREDVRRREVFAFARRQDCDDCAGLERIGDGLAERVLYFHPVYGDSSQPSPRTYDIVIATFDDVFDFVARQVIPDMKDWARTEDASEL